MFGRRKGLRLVGWWRVGGLYWLYYPLISWGWHLFQEWGNSHKPTRISMEWFLGFWTQRKCCQRTARGHFLAYNITIIPMISQHTLVISPWRSVLTYERGKPRPSKTGFRYLVLFMAQRVKWRINRWISPAFFGIPISSHFIPIFRET